MDLEEIGSNAGIWVDPAQDRDYWSLCEHGIEPPGFLGHEVSFCYYCYYYYYYYYYIEDWLDCKL